MGKLNRTTSNTQTTTLANQALNGLDDGLSMAQIITLAMTAYACKEVAK